MKYRASRFRAHICQLVRGGRIAVLRRRLAAAQVAYVASVVAARHYLADPALPVLFAAQAAVLATAYDPGECARRYRLPAGILRAVAIATAMTDFVSFLTIMLGAQDAGAQDLAGVLLGVLEAIGVAAIIPLFVLVVAEVGGHRVACLRTERRDRSDGRAVRYGQAALWISALGLLAALSFLFALHRFAGTAGDHGVSAEPALMSVVLALLPVLAFVASAARHDLAETHRASVTAGWKAAKDIVEANQAAVCDALLAWRVAWDALYDTLGPVEGRGSSLLALARLVPDPDSERTTRDIARGLGLGYPWNAAD